MNQDQQIVPTNVTNPSLPIIHAEVVRDGRYYQAMAANQVEEDAAFRQFLNFLKRRLWVLLGVSLLSMGGLGMWILTRPPLYQGSFRLLVEPLTDEQDKIRQTLELARVDRNFKQGLDYKSQIEVLRSHKVLAPLSQQLQRTYPKLDYEALLERLSIRNPLNTKLLDVSYTARDPREVEDVLRRTSARMIEYSLLERNTNLQQGLSFVDRQIVQQQQEVVRLESQVEQMIFFARMNQQKSYPSSSQTF
jgi:polysaccharide biosynthesis transport protein